MNKIQTYKSINATIIVKFVQLRLSIVFLVEEDKYYQIKILVVVN